jgi:hypothetical protein
MAGSFRPNWVPYPPPPHRHHPGFHPIRRFSNGFHRVSHRIFRPVTVMSFTLSPVASMIIVIFFILALIGTFIYLGVSGKFSSSSSSTPNVPPPYKPSIPPSPYPPSPYPPSPYPPSPYPPSAYAINKEEDIQITTSAITAPTQDVLKHLGA